MYNKTFHECYVLKLMLMSGLDLSTIFYTWDYHSDPFFIASYNLIQKLFLFVTRKQ